MIACSCPFYPMKGYLMPLLNVSISGELDTGLSAVVASQLTEMTAKHLHKDPKLTSVTVAFIGDQDWFIGRQPLVDLPVRTFSLDIKVTAGTNTKSQITSYIDAVFQGMSEILGEVADASYIIVNEVPAANWGYAGKTQEYRSVVRSPE